MNKKFKIRSTIPKSTIDSVKKDFTQLGRSSGNNKVVIGAGIGLAVLNCSLEWETKDNFIIFSVSGSHGISGGRNCLCSILYIFWIFLAIFLPGNINSPNYLLS